MIYRDHSFEFIVERREMCNVFTHLFFKRPEHFIFEAGDWVDLSYPTEKLSGGNTYSLSSSPTESLLQITFRNGQSPFKSKLQTSNPGEKFIVTRHGNDYDFYLKANRASVLIAGGVGIAPFRSMLKQLYDLHSNAEVTLIYLHQGDNILFKSELDVWENVIEGLTIFYIDTTSINKKKRQAAIASLITSSSYSFYLSGPPQMVESTEHFLINTGVPIRNIRIDRFDGY